MTSSWHLGLEQPSVILSVLLFLLGQRGLGEKGRGIRVLQKMAKRSTNSGQSCARHVSVVVTSSASLLSRQSLTFGVTYAKGRTSPSHLDSLPRVLGIDSWAPRNNLVQGIYMSASLSTPTLGRGTRTWTTHVHHKTASTGYSCYIPSPCTYGSHNRVTARSSCLCSGLLRMWHLNTNF